MRKLLYACFLPFVFLNVMSVSMAQDFTTREYEADDSNFPNPERGFYHHTETSSGSYSPLNEETLRGYRDEGITLILRVFYLTDFVSQPLPDQYLASVGQDFNTARAAGVKVIVRFAYTKKSTAPYGDATPEWALKHIEQLKPVLQANADVIAVVQAGFIGAWGEWYYTDHFSASLGSPNEQDWINRRALVYALLDATPASRAVQLRTPAIKFSILESTEPLTAEDAFSLTPEARLGHHNDCFLASANDVGTYTGNMEAEKAYLEQETNYLPMGGETCGESVPLSECPNALAQMERFHWSYLNRDYHSGVLGSWETGSCLSDVYQKLGHRFRITKASLQENGKPGGEMNFTVKLVNDGWANPYNKRSVELLLRNKSTGKMYVLPVDEDPRRWSQTDTISVEVQAGLSGNFSEGAYDLLLNLPAPEISIRNNPDYSIRLANTGVWETETGYNNLNHTVTVSKTANVPDYTGEAFFLSKPAVIDHVSISTDGIGTEWEAIESIALSEPGFTLKGFNDTDSLYFLLTGNEAAESFNIYIDVDPSAFSGSLIDPWNSNHADYRINGDGISAFVDGSWSAAEPVNVMQNSNVLEISIANDLFAEMPLGSEIEVAAIVDLSASTVHIPSQENTFAEYRLLLNAPLSVKATSSGEKVILYWGDVSDQFRVIERSSDGDNFETVAVLDPETFLFTDNAEGLSSVAYRSHHVSDDGARVSTFSEVASVELTTRPDYYVFTADAQPEEWEGVAPVATALLHKETQAYRIFPDAQNLNVLYEGETPDSYTLYFDLDNVTTGFSGNPWNHDGFEYLVSNDSVFEVNANGPVFIQKVGKMVSGQFTEISIPLDVMLIPEGNTVIYTAAVITVGEQTLYYPQSGSAAAKFLRILPATPPANVTVSNSENLPETQLIIQWDACSGCKGYIVERSEGNSDNFEVIATKSRLTLAHFDNDLATGKTYFYRLFNYNDAGISEPSEIVSGTPAAVVSVETPAMNGVSVFPNPANNFLHLRLPAELHGTGIEIFNSMGNVVLKTSVTDSQSDLTIDVSRLPAGVYLLKLKGSGFFQVRFIRQ